MTEEKFILLVTGKNFLKIAVKFDLEKFNEMPELLEEAYIKLSEILA